MEKIKVLIIRDEDDYSLDLSNIITEMLASLGVKSDFFYADDEDFALQKIGFWGYGIICSHTSTSKSSSFLSELQDYKLRAGNKNLATFFILSNEQEVLRIKEFGFNLFLLKGKQQSITLDDLMEVKQVILSTGKISCQIQHQDLINPVCVFSQTYADSTPSEVLAQDACDRVARELNRKQINYSVFDPLGYYIEVSVENERLSEVIEVLSNYMCNHKYLSD
ncbi:MAG: hypothetical protein WCK59_00600 [Candidatus Falkowbacteria bacterium]